MAEELMLKVEDVYKKYRLGTIGGGTLTADLQSWWARVRHKEDPNSKSGAKNYGKNEVFYALNGISFEVRKGEALGIIGGNGAGKSTTLKLISQVTAPTKGKIYLNGRITSMLEVGTGFHPELTGRENIYLNGAILGMTKAEIDRKIEEIIDFSECRQFIDTPVKRYSSGMYVKLAFSVAAHLDSEIMIMDEVLAVGDMKFQEKCLGKMNDVSVKNGKTILYVSHNMNTIRRLCERCIVLDHGSIIFDGDVEKAIGMYMSSIPVSDSNVDLHNFFRGDQFQDKTVWIENIRIETENSIFNTGSTINGCISVFSQKELNDLRFEMPLKSVAGIPISRVLSDPIITLKENQITEIPFSVDISAIAPGRYTLGFIFREINSWGTQKSLDGVSDAYCFEIVSTPEFNNGTEWNPVWSGYYVAPKILLK